MGIDDREYSRGSGGGWGGGADLGRRVLAALNYTFGIGTVLGIRIRVHITFIVLLLIFMISSGDPLWTLRWSLLLFGSVLLHEFGHCLACRKVGGEADEILMWPLGGLAMCRPPHHPWPEFVTVIWGPLVNVILAGAAYLALLLMLGTDIPVTLNPFTRYVAIPPDLVTGVLADLFVVNYILLLFNLLLIFYPFDGGRLVQIALWTRVGYGKSMLFATRAGMVGAVIVGIIGLIAMADNRHGFLLVLIAIFGGLTCYQQARQLRYAGAYESGFDVDFGGKLGGGYGSASSGATERISRAQRKAQRRVQKETIKRRELEQQVDRILEKVSRHGVQSLSGKEKRILEKASQKSGQR
jgi:Zn-dependent protease